MVAHQNIGKNANFKPLRHFAQGFQKGNPIVIYNKYVSLFVSS